MQKKRKNRSIFRMILLPLLIVMAVESVMLIGGISLSGVNDRLNRNSRDILEKQAENRKNYIQNSMVDNWASLTMLASEINDKTEELLQSGDISLENLDGSSDVCAPLVLKISDDLISELYAKKVSGIFVIFNTHNLDAISGDISRTGIYLRDLDPNSAPSYRNADILLMRAPISVVRALKISTDSAWQPLYTFGPDGGDCAVELYYPFQTAYETEASVVNCGYWSTEPHILPGDDRTSISYSIPLVLPDGTVYGVLGVELLTEYLSQMMPGSELFEDRQGSYILANSRDGGETYSSVIINGNVSQALGVMDEISLIESENGYTFMADGDEYFASVRPMTLYNSNAPFSGDHWALIGAVRTEKLYEFSGLVSKLVLLAGLLSLTVGIVGCVLVAQRLSRPVSTLSGEVERAQSERGGMPVFDVTGITEIDRFSQAITSLSRDVLDSSTRFLRIMKMASVEMGGFELRKGSDAVFVTDNYFSLLGLEGVDVSKLDSQRFIELVKQRHEALEHTRSADGSILYRVITPQGGLRYLRVEVTPDGERFVGLAEDVTAATTERMRIEHERDYDLLTGLLNRRAFQREAGALFSRPDKMRHAALLMLDLDNLKTTNDRFGHDWGDQYIRRAGQCFAKSSPVGTLTSRVSGDEFLLLYHGFEKRNDIRDALQKLSRDIFANVFMLPDGEEIHISASGGVAWYPEDSTDLSELTKFADFAMYQMKRSRKGQLGDFDLGIYNRAAYLNQSRREFRRLIDEELIEYHFQPIVSTITGEPLAYEALMRVNMSTLRSPEAVIELAKEEGRLHDVERITWFKAAEAFEALLGRGLVPENAMLFINSMASQCMDEDEERKFNERFGYLQPRMVVEITESEHMDPEALRAKRECPGFSGVFALDDYGSGYNSEKNLLELAPTFIKVDISIISGIDNDMDKQQIVSNIVAYAHERGQYIIAEGLETAAEVTKSLELGVDLMQGYFLARPAVIPPQISPAALELLRGK